MRRFIVYLPVGMVLALSACASAPEVPPPSPIPLAVDAGLGSQHGNYAAQADGQTTGPYGEHCTVFNWDRPLDAESAVRLRSASCESLDRPGRMVARELSREVIPLTESNLRSGGDGDAP